MRTIVATFLLVFLAALPAAAQETPRAEVYGGYSYLRLDTPAPRVNLNGWHAGVAGNLNSWFSLVGDFSGHYGTRLGADARTHQALFGPRVRLPGGFSPYGHVLFGLARGSAGVFGSTGSDSAFGMAVGGGVDLRFGRHFGVRAIQADYLRTRLFDSTQNNARISTGVFFRF